MVELNYKEYGEGSPVIILHGLFGMLDNWQTIAKHLAANNMIFLIDQRNHGRSPHTDDEVTYKLLAEDLKEFMEAHWIYKAHIIGHSMGGKTAMQFALDNPDMVDSLVVIDIAPKEYEAGHDLVFSALRSLDIATLTERKVAAEELAKTIKDIGTLQFLLKNLTLNHEGRFEWKMNLSVLWRDYHNILGNVTGDAFEGKTLFIRGQKSDYVQDSDIMAIHDLFPNAQVQTIADAGHWVHAEKPKELLESLAAFYSTCA